jgi:hypothetical protein
MTAMGDTTAMLELAERCEAAAAEQQRELLIASAEAALIADGQDADTEDTMGWLDRFEALVEVGAYIDAALTLVPEGYDWNAGICVVEGFPRGEANVCPQQTQPFPVELGITVEAATPALALTAASLRARAAQNVQSPRSPSSIRNG